MLAEPRHDTLVAGRFVLGGRLARGGPGELYSAIDRATGDRVVLRLLSCSTTSHERFNREVAQLAALEHPGIVRHVAHGTTPAGQRFVATEWLDGEELSVRLRREPMSVGEVVAMGAALSRALAAAHDRGVLHLDLNPGSVMLPGFRAAKAKLLDFAPVRARDPVRDLTRGVASMATRGYVAPELALGERHNVGPRTDLFALGCVLYEALCGEAAFEAADAREVVRRILFVDPSPLAPRVHGLPMRLADLVSALLAKDPDDRPPAASAVAAVLAETSLSAPRAGVRLQVVKGADRGLARLVVEGAIDIGTHPCATLPLTDPDVARFHCEIVRDGGALVVCSLGGESGVEVDGARIQRGGAHHGSILALGATRVRVELTAQPDLGLAALDVARAGDMHVMLEGAGWDAKTFAQRLHDGSGRRGGPHMAVYGAALRIDDLVHVSGGTLLLLEPETLGAQAQRMLARFVEARAVSTAHGPRHADVRLVTHAPVDLRPSVNARRFLPELFLALAGIRLTS